MGAYAREFLFGLPSLDPPPLPPSLPEPPLSTVMRVGGNHHHIGHIANFMGTIYGNDLAWLQTFFTLFLSLTFPLWTDLHLNRLLRHFPGRDSKVSAPGNQQQQGEWQLLGFAPKTQLQLWEEGIAIPLSDNPLD